VGVPSILTATMFAGPQRWIPVPPSRCAVCGAWPAQPLCAACIARLAVPRHRCARCALPVAQGVAVCGACVRTPPPLDACHAALDYAYPWSGLIARFKFSGEAGWAQALAQRLAQAPGMGEEVRQADVLLPMPLAPRRLAERGFNQALLLARALDRRKSEPRLLLRLRETPPQSQLDRDARQENVDGAFAIEPLRAGELRGASVLLVDDVMTSGASLHAAARAVRQAGAKRVAAAVLARTDN
jgi:ComF family protein